MYKKTLFSLLTILSFLITMSLNSHSYEDSSENICQAIYWAEGGIKAHSPFGIRPLGSVRCNSYQSCYRICLNTVNNKRSDWNQLAIKSVDFLAFLSKKYAEDHETWLKNVKWFLEHPKPILDNEKNLWLGKDICASGNNPDRICF